ncbi:MAG TPA: acetoacetate--CoA ligase [Gemmatimonadaceae bacterium]|nr:acetoacetate--CoA ligase [Gemmatimonadaceae bacterium]
MTHPLWIPTTEQIARAHVTRFIAEVRALGGAAAAVTDFDSLREWSLANPERFWALVWRFGGVVADERAGDEPWDAVLVGRERVAPPDPVLGPRWFTGARLNFAENLLRRRGADEAIVSWTEEGRRGALTWDALHAEVERVARAFAAMGVGVGDRVVGFLPNLPEAVVAMLAAVRLGAIWSSCSPDFGVQGVLDRFGQIAPKVLVAADGYRYAGKEIDLRERVADVVSRIPSIDRAVVVAFREPGDLSGIRGAAHWNDLPEARRGALEAPAFVRLPFDHPLYVMYSSGTTGLPKCMVHGAGGTLVQHLKELLLHTDVGPTSRVFYFTTCGWMMWNWLVSCLATGATIVLYDGAPLPRHRPAVLWDMAEAERITVFGTSAKYIALAEKEGLAPARTHALPALEAILSTGSPLAPQGFDFVYRDVKRDVRLSSISGGTDIISCFAGGNPIGPVWRGELQALALGMRVDVFDETGRPVRGRPGELVCTAPFPSMPVAFWNDPDGAKYRAAYFAHWPNVWRHGDWAEITAHGGMVIHGRSDATLNPGGVRIGTAEIYRQVEQLDEVVESVVIGQEVQDGGDTDVRIVLFVRLRDGVVLDDALRERIRRRIRENATPHHVPRRIVQVADIPRTISGKITELAVRDVVHGRAVANVEALANPGALALFRDLEELQG